MNRPVGLLLQDKRLSIDTDSLPVCLWSMEQVESYLVAPGPIEVAFVDEAESSRLHHAFFDDPEPTDVMTFPADPGDNHAGDIAICPAIAAANCAREGIPFAEELTLYLVHAWLHLSGLRDDDDEARREMRRGESTLMQAVKDAGAVLKASWSD